MKAAVTIEGGRLALAELEPPALKAGQARVAVTYCGICGSDLHWRTHFPPGTVMGHEVVGRVLELAADVEGWSPGERVVIMPADPCGACPSCRSGASNICSNRRYGIGGPRAWGGYAESVVVMATMLLRLPQQLADRTAALVEPLAVGLHGVNQLELDPASLVAIIGAGTIGLSAVLALRAHGFERLVVIEPNAARRANVAHHGFATVDPTASEPTGQAVARIFNEAPIGVVECAGYPAAVADAIRIAAPRGRVVLLSAPAVPVPLPQWDMMSKEVQLRSAIFYTREEFAHAIEWLATGQVLADAIPTRVFALADAPQALNELIAPNTPHLKVLLKP